MTSDFEAIRRARRQSEHISDVLRKSEQISRDFDLWRAAGVNPPTPRRSITMQNVSILKLAVGILGVGFLGCLGGIIWLAAAEPARAIPDVLVAISTGTLGLIGGILVPNKAALPDRGQRGESVVTIAVVVVLVLAAIWLLSLLIR